MTYGIEFLGKHSFKDFGLAMSPGKSIGIPDKRKIKVAIPFSNVEYDFSEIYGSQVYGNRQLTYPFNVYDPRKPDKKRMNIVKTTLINWLMNSSGKQRLYDDTFPGYYFLAEVEGQMAFEENWESGVLTATFTAYPFMISELKEGHDIWDDINFDFDVLQPVDFNVSGSLDVTLHNVGTASLTPTIEASSQMEIVKDNITYTVPSGKSESMDFNLKPGDNELTITGNGSISFEFYKELI